ncbi:nucleotidyltransferase family protein [Klebsiella pasteurii]|uniref:Nucleotidyltransferase family protein n=1 Tax=Klebsiella pasteurii TaxID=2587529 RepID=A0ABT5CNM9_9ENTR|nr:nucleotidyltransferase family protein [Klebsiella pasteurii]MDC0693155.1 nucleotidyltransferase family protein [Klebsiella pasteurii]MDC0754904.1 nucleotidyltransferase family protein [Klebsiella pasteurii]MDQ2169627.1 nucleotidyltransferase family protein [Klebsiella pasteurii]MDQ2201310.1 nucleotidyltransferase family protein [Klebsiella pasteurii]MDQ2223095.1 nucleotidyltransferase family protein [Klebsiella pasteurii]
MKYQDLLQSVLLNDPIRMNALYAVQALELNDGWIGAGFVRDAVWDHLHSYGLRPVSGDVDVVWFDAKSATSACDSALEERLSQQNSAFNWSVKNQARMHQRNGHQPYHSTENALLYWPETATAMAVRMGGTDHIEIIAPYGLDDLFELRLRPTPVFAQHKLAIFRQRVVEKRWLQRYPGLRLLVPT